MVMNCADWPQDMASAGDPIFQRRYALLENICCRVHDARVDVAEFLEREEFGGLLGIFEDEGRGLVDGDGAGSVVGSG